MAANMKAVKLRIKSVESTMQITKAMELVASSKLRKAKERADTCRPYFQELYRTLQDIAKGNTEFYSIYAKEAKNEKCCYVLVAGDRGLAGGYNANLFRCFEADAKRKEICVVPVGKKAVEYAKSRKLDILTDSFAEIANLSVAALRSRAHCAVSSGKGPSDMWSFVTQNSCRCCRRCRFPCRSCL